MKALLVASSGGHLAELVLLRDRLPDITSETWVTFEGPQVDALLQDRPRVLVPDVAPRDWRAAAAAVPAAVRLLRSEAPDLVVSTGAAVAVPYLMAAAAMGIPTYYVESAARQSRASMTGRILRRVPRVHVLAQYESLGSPWHHVGSIFDAFEPAPPRLEQPRLRVLVTVGTMKFSFHRLVDRLAANVPDDVDVVWQLGHTTRPDGLSGEVVSFMSQSALEQELTAADVVVTHAGVGSAIAALEVGLSPVLVPRRHSFGEHVDDHQADLAGNLAALGLATHLEADTLTWDDIRRAACRRTEKAARPVPIVLPGVSAVRTAA